jgi:tRNA U34 5-carboxymethylaminomethyl modifying GTPase MnmE/TrmE
MLFDGFVTAEEAIQADYGMPNLRQRKRLEAARDHFKNILDALTSKMPLDLISEMIHSGIKEMREISGTRDDVSLYDHIFNQFCVGK